MTDSPSDRFRAQILKVFPAHAAREGWTDAAFKAAVAEAGLSEGEAALACPKGAFDLFDAFAARADAAMLERLDGLDLGAMKIRQVLDDDDVPLTQRETQVLRHVALGLSNKEIGRSLEISVETVKEHVQNILRKLEAGDRTEAAVWAVKKGLV